MLGCDKVPQQLRVWSNLGVLSGHQIEQTTTLDLYLYNKKADCFIQMETQDALPLVHWNRYND